MSIKTCLGVKTNIQLWYSIVSVLGVKALLITDSTSALVYASFGLQINNMIAVARQDFDILGKKNGNTYLLNHVRGPSEQDIAMIIETHNSLDSQFVAVMENPTKYSNIESTGIKYKLIFGTPDQKLVWEELLNIPPGHTRSYKEVAAAIGKPTASRFVGTACGANKIAGLIPCHRVLTTSNTMGGYRWGTDIKQLLLQQEGVALRHKATVTKESIDTSV